MAVPVAPIAAGNGATNGETKSVDDSDDSSSAPAAKKVRITEPEEEEDDSDEEADFEDV